MRGSVREMFLLSENRTTECILIDGAPRTPIAVFETSFPASVVNEQVALPQV